MGRMIRKSYFPALGRIPKDSFGRWKIPCFPELQIEFSGSLPQFLQKDAVHPDSAEEVLDQHVFIRGVDA